MYFGTGVVREACPMLIKLALVSAVVVIVGCASSSIVMLKHPATGNVVQCGPYRGGFGVAAENNQLTELKYCINDFQRQGYERLPD